MTKQEITQEARHIATTIRKRRKSLTNNKDLRAYNGLVQSCIKYLKEVYYWLDKDIHMATMFLNEAKSSLR